MKMRKKSLCLISVVLLTASVAVAGAGYIWWGEAENFARLQGTVKGGDLITEEVTVEMGTLYPGQGFATEQYSTTFSHNVYYEDLELSIYTATRDLPEFRSLVITGSIEDAKTGEKIDFCEDLTKTYVGIAKVPINGTITFSFTGQAECLLEDHPLDDITIVINIYRAAKG